MESRVQRSKLTKKQKNCLAVVESGTLLQVQNIAPQISKLRKNEFFGYMLLVTALQRGHKSISKFLIKENCSVQAHQTGSHCTPLYYAVKMNDIEIFKALWIKGASIFDKDVNKDSALELIISENRYDMMYFTLYSLQISKNSQNLQSSCTNDMAVFHAACWANDLEAIETFLSRGFSVHSRSDFNSNELRGLTPLHFAIKDREYLCELVIATLLDYGADFQAEDENGRTPLHLAFRGTEGFSYHDDIIAEHMTSLRKSRLVNPRDKNGLTHFHIFCSMKHQDEDSTESLRYVKYYIDRKVDVNCQVSSEDEDFPGYTALHFAAQKQSWKLIELLLENDADPTKTTQNGLTPLHLICRNHEQRLDIIKLFLQHGADPNANDSLGRTPLHFVFRSSFAQGPLNESEKYLLSKNIQSINYTDERGVSYLHMACLGNDPGIVKSLIANGAQVNSLIHGNLRRYAGYSPLHIAVESNRVDFVEVLLANGADVNSCINNETVTSLHLACDHTSTRFYGLYTVNNNVNTRIDWIPTRKSHIQIIKLLIQRGAIVDAKKWSNETSLLINCHVPNSIMLRRYAKNQAFLDCMLDELLIRQKIIMKYLLLHGADINSHCSLNGSVLHILSRNYSTSPLIKNLLMIALKSGADVNSVDHKGFTPLHIAVNESMRNGCDTSLIDLLLRYGANINAKSRTSTTPLHEAVSHFSTENERTVSKLLSHSDIDINARTNSNRTPLHIAVSQRNLSCTQELLDAGADINLKDNDGLLPFDILVSRLENYDDFDEYSPSVLPFVILHMKKLIKLQFHISEEVNKLFKALSRYMSEDTLALIDSYIDEELNTLRSEKLDSYTSLYDILVRDSSDVAKYVSNNILRIMILSIRKGNYLPLLGSFVERQFNKGLKRLKLLEPAKTALNFISNLHWPDYCSEQILSYLSDDILKDLIKSTVIEKNRKRSTEILTPVEIPPAKRLRRRK